MVEITQYIKMIEERLKLNYDVETQVQFNNYEIDLFAKLEIKNEKYFASKSVSIWTIEKFDYVFVKKVDKLTEKSLTQFREFLKKVIYQHVKPSTEHMSSTITGVIIVDEIPVELEKAIRQFKYRKTYALSLKGWVDIRLVVINLEMNSAVSNKKGKGVTNYFLPVIEKKNKGLFKRIRKDNKT